VGFAVELKVNPVVRSNPVDTDDKAEFLFTVWYFKPSGKFYTEASFRRVVRTCGPTRGAYMHDAVAHVRGLRDSGGQGALPGLCSGGWDGFILVNCEEGYLCLIPPG
jgi:hypothetical protein